MITVNDVSFRHTGATFAALVNVEWSPEPGLHVVHGPSGSGKSTLLRLLNGLVPHFHGGTISGTVTVAGINVLEASTRRMATHVGFVFQDPELQSVGSRVRRDIAFAPENLGLERSVINRRVAEAMERTGTTALAERRMTTLSGGERQRVAIASALACRPQILVLDEPLSQLDPAGAAEVVLTCRALVADGTTVIIAEHRLDDFAERTPAHVMAGGRLLRRRSVADLVTAPVTAAQRAGSGPPLLTADDVALRPGREVVASGITIDLRGGDIVVIRGDNGCGKSTLLRSLAGCIATAAGRIERHARVAYLPQQPGAMLHRASVLDEVRFSLRGDERTRTATASVVLSQLGIDHLADRSPRDLSGGERQRAAIAAVLAGSPPVALLDEPTRGMDEISRQRLVALLGSLADSGAAIVVASHDRRLAAELGARSLTLTPTGLTAELSPAAV